MISSATFFGLPNAIDLREATELSAYLTKLWQSNYGKGVGSLPTDLRAMKLFFDPIASGRRLRDSITHVKPVPSSGLRLDTSMLVLPLGDGRYLIRPEGRIVLETLENLLIEADTSEVIVPAADRLEAMAICAQTYSEWSGHRLLTVVDRLKGEVSLQAQPAGVILWLLVNRCTDATRFFPNPKEAKRSTATKLRSEELRHRLDEIIAGPVQAFAKCLSPGRTQREARKFELRSGWQLTEAKRRLGALIQIEEHVYIVPGKEDEVIAILAHDISSRKNYRSTFDFALSAFMVEFRNQSHRLAALGYYYERTADTEHALRELRHQIEAGP